MVLRPWLRRQRLRNLLERRLDRGGLPLEQFERGAVVVRRFLAEERRHAPRLAIEEAHEPEHEARRLERGHLAVARGPEDAREGGHLDGLGARGDRAFSGHAERSEGLDVQARDVAHVDHAHRHVGDHRHLSGDHVGHHGYALAFEHRTQRRPEDGPRIDHDEFHRAALGGLPRGALGERLALRIGSDLGVVVGPRVGPVRAALLSGCDRNGRRGEHEARHAGTPGRSDDALGDLDGRSDHLVFVLRFGHGERGRDVHDEGAAHHRGVPAAIREEIGLRGAQAVDGYDLRKRRFSRVGLVARADCPDDLLALAKKLGGTVLTDVARDSGQ